MGSDDSDKAEVVFYLPAAIDFWQTILLSELFACRNPIISFFAADRSKNTKTTAFLNKNRNHQIALQGGVCLTANTANYTIECSEIQYIVELSIYTYNILWLSSWQRCETHVYAADAENAGQNGCMKHKFNKFSTSKYQIRRAKLIANRLIWFVRRMTEEIKLHVHRQGKVWTVCK